MSRAPGGCEYRFPLLVVRRDIYSFYRLQRPTQTQELPQTSKMFDVSTDIEEIGRIKAEIMRILQNFLDESIDVCYIEDAANFREMLMIPSFLRRAQCLSNNDNLKGCSTSLRILLHYGGDYLRYDLRISGLSSVRWADANAYFCARSYRGTSLSATPPTTIPAASRHEGLAFWVLTCKMYR